MSEIIERIPHLRFPGLQDKSMWNKYKLGEIARLLKGKGISKSDVSDVGTTPCVRYGELYTHYKGVIDEVKSFTNLPSGNLFMSQANDVIIPSSGETKEDIATASCVLHDGIAIGGDINVIRSSNNGVFLAYYLNNAKKNDIAKIAQGISIIHLYNEQLSNLSIELPSIEEQQIIADCLHSIDQYILSIGKKIDQLKEHKKGLLYKLFPQKGQPFPEYRFPVFRTAGKWELKTLGNIAKIKSGYAFKSDTYVSNGKYKIVTIKNVKNGHLDLVDYNTLNELPKDIQSHQILRKGDILISMTGNVGRVCVVDNSFCLLNQRVGLVDISSKSVDKDFLYSVLTDTKFEQAMIKSGQGAAQANIGNKDIENYQFACPTNFREQQMIATCLSSVDNAIKSYVEKKYLLVKQKRGLLQQLFPTSK